MKLATAGLITILFGFKDFHSSVHLLKSARNTASDIFLFLRITLSADQSPLKKMLDSVGNVMSLDSSILNSERRRGKEGELSES